MAALNPALPLTVVEVNGKRFASGLTWIPLSKPHGYMDEARKLGKEKNMDMVAIRKSGTNIQAGFAPRSQQKLRGVYSLAAALGGTLGSDWIGIFQLGEDRYAFIAVHNGLVMVGRDIVGDRATVEREFNDVYNLLAGESTEDRWSDRGRIVAPADWDFATDHATLEQLLHPKQLRNEHKLRPLTFNLTVRELVLILVTLGVLVGAAAGFLQWQKVKAARQSAEATQQRIALEAALAAKAQAAVEKPWESLPDNAALFAACADHWRTTRLSVGGWIFKAGTCTPTGAAASYTRPTHGTTLSQFVGQATAYGLGGVEVFESGEEALFVKVLRLKPTGAAPLPTQTATLQAFTSAMQESAEAAGTVFTLKEKPWEAPANNPQQPAPDWKTTTFEVTSGMTPEQLFGAFPAAGVRIREISASLSPDDATLTWKTTGEIYAR